MIFSMNRQNTPLRWAVGKVQNMRFLTENTAKRRLILRSLTGERRNDEPLPNPPASEEDIHCLSTALAKEKGLFPGWQFCFDIGRYRIAAKLLHWRYY
jgi:hypothetical protein